MNDILEGYYSQQKRENDKMLFNARMLRKAAFISILPHTKGLTENRFNKEVWPIGEDDKTEENEMEERAKKAGKAMKKYFSQLKESRLKKQNK